MVYKQNQKRRKKERCSRINNQRYVTTTPSQGWEKCRKHVKGQTSPDQKRNHPNDESNKITGHYE